jgi:hypothetical protein
MSPLPAVALSEAERVGLSEDVLDDAVVWLPWAEREKPADALWRSLSRTEHAVGYQFTKAHRAEHISAEWKARARVPIIGSRHPVLDGGLAPAAQGRSHRVWLEQPEYAY